MGTMNRPQRLRRPGERGTTLLEAMIALTVLLVGLVGMARLQIFGVNATAGGRAQTVATQLAGELGDALAQLPAGDLQLSGAEGSDPNTPPAGFGALVGVVPLPTDTPPAGMHVWSDATPVPGARLDAALRLDVEIPTEPEYKRRWTVWNAGVAANGTAAKVIAVSVIWRERGLARRREVVRLVHSEVRGSFMSNINAFN
jgi:hypothetical protein